MYGENEQSLHLTFQPTNACNLKCSYCYQNNKGNEYLPIEDGKYLIDKLFQNDKGYFKDFLHDDYLNVILDFIGGEATLHMDFVNSITDYFIQQCIKHRKDHWLINFEVWLQTNGTTYFNDDVQAFIKKHYPRLDLPITLDGSKECHDACRKYHDDTGSYDDVIDAMRHYIKTYNKFPNTKLTVSPDNIHKMADGLKEFVAFGYSEVRISCVNEDVWKPEHDTIWQEQLRKFYDYLIETKTRFKLGAYSKLDNYTNELRGGTCGSHGNSLCMNYKGDFYLCARFSEISDLKGKEPLVVGNIKNGITEKGLRIIEDVKASSQKTQCTESCFDCKIGKICESCPAFNYEHNDRLFGIIKTNCNKNKIAYEELQRYLKLKDSEVAICL